MPQEKVNGEDKVFLLGEQHDGVRKLRAILEEWGFHTATLPSLEAGYAVVQKGAVACIWISRAKLPTPEDVKLLRDHAIRVPIIVASGTSTSEERRSLLRAGCDDCVGLDLDPTEAAELVMARIRQYARAGSFEFAAGRFRLEPARRRIHRYDEKEAVSEQFGPLEYALIDLLARDFGNIVSRSTIRSVLWAHEEEWDDQRMPALILRARRKAEAIGGLRLVTVRGKGVVLRLIE